MGSRLRYLVSAWVGAWVLIALSAAAEVPREAANKALCHRVYEALNTGRIELLDSLVSADAPAHQDTKAAPAVSALELLQATAKAFREGMSGVEFKVLDMVAEGDKVAVRLRLSGRHTGFFLGLEPSNKSFSVDAFDLFRIEEGKIVEYWGMVDTFALLRQLGVLAPNS